jgi:hypothetical protein
MRARRTPEEAYGFQQNSSFYAQFADDCGTSTTQAQICDDAIQRFKPFVDDIELSGSQNSETEDVEANT